MSASELERQERLAAQRAAQEDAEELDQYEREDSLESLDDDVLRMVPRNRKAGEEWPPRGVTPVVVAGTVWYATQFF